MNLTDYNVICEVFKSRMPKDKEMHLAARVIAFCFLLFLSIPASADSLTGKVVKITDGDTLYVLDANYASA